MENELISVVMPVYNAYPYLIESINSILNQTYDNFEFIILNDGSQDNSKDIILSFNDKRIKYFEHDNIGIQKTLNRGLFESKGSFIARMDADDICYPNRLSEQLNFMQNNPNCVVLGCNAEYMDIEGNTLYRSNLPLMDYDIKKTLSTGGSFFHSSVMYKKESVLKCGLYIENIKTSIEDGVLWIKMAKLGELRNLEKCLLKYRLSPSALSNRSPSRKKYINLIFEDIFAERIPNPEWIKKLDDFNKKENLKWKLSHYYYRIGTIYEQKVKNKRKAFEFYMRSLKYNLLNPRALIKLILNYRYLPEK